MKWQTTISYLKCNINFHIFNNSNNNDLASSQRNSIYFFSEGRFLKNVRKLNFLLAVIVLKYKIIILSVTSGQIQ